MGGEKLKAIVVDWNEQPLERWLGEVIREHTKRAYKQAWKAYTQYTGKTATELLHEADEDTKQEVTERKGVLKRRLIGFYKWLVKEYPVRSRGQGQHVIIRKGLRPKSANMYVQAIRSFYATFDLTVKLKGKSKLPKPKVYNKKMQLSILDVKKLVDHARTPRDRAMILTMFQSGMDVSTLCSLKYEDVKGKLENPLKLELYREKSGIEYYTFLGNDAVESIRTYLNDLKSRGVTLKPKDSLFIKETRKNGELQPMETHLVQKVLREDALRSGLVDSENNGHDHCPVSPHALRKSFGSIMINKGVPDTIVDFWLGHTIGEMAEAYKSRKLEELKRMYLEKERFISIVTPIPPEMESALIEQKATTKTLTGLYAEEKKRREELEERQRKTEKIVENLHRKLSEYEECEPLSVLLKGGLPAKMFERLLSQWMHEGLTKLEQDEMEG